MDQDQLPQVLLEQDKDLIWAVDTQLRVIYVNTSFKRYYQDRREKELQHQQALVSELEDEDVRIQWHTYWR